MSIYKELTIESNIRDYAACFSSDFRQELEEDIKDENYFIIDMNVAHLYGEKLRDILTAKNHIIVEAVETNKNIRMAESIIKKLLTINFRKNGRLIAIGGGIIQDLTGFIASILFRGVNWSFYPTTLLAQADSCIGSKTSINVDEYKNQLGTFNPPGRIVVDLSFLNTLTEQAVRSGIGEMIKVHLLDSFDSWTYLKDTLPLAIHDQKILSNLLFNSLKIKKKVIEIDEFDTDYRNIMNYGHTFGHAIESVTEYRLMHGEAVIIGMDISNYISMKIGLISESWYYEMRSLLKENWPEYDLQTLDVECFLGALMRDKKNIGQSVTMVLTKGPGKMFKETKTINDDFKGLIISYLNI